jgi:hypothetical protein
VFSWKWFLALDKNVQFATINGNNRQPRKTMVRKTKEESSQLHSSQSLENSVSRIEQLLVAARRVAAEMDRLKTGSIWIGTQPSFDCAMGDLSRWGKACEDALTARLKEMGHFRAEAEVPPPKSARKTGKEKKSRRTSS